MPLSIRPLLVSLLRKKKRPTKHFPGIRARSASGAILSSRAARSFGSNSELERSGIGRQVSGRMREWRNWQTRQI
jgi:hypothetical protein